MESSSFALLSHKSLSEQTNLDQIVLHHLYMPARFNAFVLAIAFKKKLLVSYKYPTFSAVFNEQDSCFCYVEDAFILNIADFSFVVVIPPNLPLYQHKTTNKAQLLHYLARYFYQALPVLYPSLWKNLGLEFNVIGDFNHNPQTSYKSKVTVFGSYSIRQCGFNYLLKLNIDNHHYRNTPKAIYLNGKKMIIDEFIPLCSRFKHFTLEQNKKALRSCPHQQSMAQAKQYLTRTKQAFFYIVHHNIRALFTQNIANTSQSSATIFYTQEQQVLISAKEKQALLLIAQYELSAQCIENVYGTLNMLLHMPNQHLQALAHAKFAELYANGILPELKINAAFYHMEQTAVLQKREDYLQVFAQIKAGTFTMSLITTMLLDQYAQKLKADALFAEANLQTQAEVHNQRNQTNQDNQDNQEKLAKLSNLSFNLNLDSALVEDLFLSYTAQQKSLNALGCTILYSAMAYRLIKEQKAWFYLVQEQRALSAQQGAKLQELFKHNNKFVAMFKEVQAIILERPLRPLPAEFLAKIKMYKQNSFDDQYFQKALDRLFVFMQDELNLSSLYIAHFRLTFLVFLLKSMGCPIQHKLWSLFPLTACTIEEFEHTNSLSIQIV